MTRAQLPDKGCFTQQSRASILALVRLRKNSTNHIDHHVHTLSNNACLSPQPCFLSMQKAARHPPAPSRSRT
eukprot:865152-Alexandrium_andersonii.AAC.1